jgi:tetratricopeptide (TPR) repeat protein
MPFAAEAWQRVATELDRYSLGWGKLQERECRAGFTGKDSGRAELASECLADAFDAMRSLTDLLVTADGQMVRRSVDAVQALPLLASCADDDALRSRVPPPRDPSVALKVRDLRSRLAQATALHEAGKYEPALERAQAAAHDARLLAYPAIEAEAWFAAGRTAIVLGRADLAEETLARAVHAANAGRHDAVTVLGWNGLMYVDGVLRERADEALRWNDLSAAVLGRLRDDGLEAERLFTLSVIYNKTGRNRDAIEAVRKALPLLERRLGAEHRRTATAQMALAWYLEQEGQFDEARRLAEAALEGKKRVLGAHHPSTATEEGNVGSLLIDQGLYRESLPHLEQALAILEAQPIRLGAEAQFLGNLGEVLSLLGRDQEARRPFERGLQVARKTSERVQILAGLAMLDHRAGRDEKAMEEFAQALALVKPSDALAARPLRLQAEVELACGRPEHALELGRRALSIVEQTRGATSFRAGPVLRGMGESLLALGNSSAATTVLERALPLVRVVPGWSAEVARVEELLKEARHRSSPTAP